MLPLRTYLCSWAPPFIWSPIHPPLYPSTYPPLLYIHLSIHSPFHPPTHPSIYPPSHPHTPSPIHLLTYSPPVHLFISPPIHTSAYPSSIYPSIHPLICRRLPIHSPTRPFTDHPLVYHMLISAYSHPSKRPLTLLSTQLPTYPLSILTYPLTHVYTPLSINTWIHPHMPSSIHPSACKFGHLNTYLLTPLSIYSPVFTTPLFIHDHPSTYPFTYPFIHSSTHPSNYQSTPSYPPICLTNQSPIHPNTQLTTLAPIHSSTHLSTHPPIISWVPTL